MAGLHSGSGHGVYGRSNGGAAGFFDGNATVTGTLTVLNDIVLPGGGDCAERFDTAGGESIESGSIVFIDRDGVRECERAYDTKLVGVVAGAGSYRPAIILDARSDDDRVTAKIAVFGKVYCKADARYGAIAVGDLLTSSDTAGHAMRVSDKSRAFGAVLGKALKPLPQGRGLIPIVVTML